MEYTKDTNNFQKDTPSKNSLILELFEKDSSSVFIFRKSEKIVSALYLVSNFFSDSEPMKWQLRHTGTAIVSGVLSFNLDSSSAAKLTLVTDVIRALSLIQIAWTAGLVTDMNSSIIAHELEDLLSVLNTKISKRERVKASFDKEFFAVSEHELINKDESAELLPEVTISAPRAYTMSDVAKIQDFHKRQTKGQSSQSEKSLPPQVVLPKKDTIEIFKKKPLVSGPSTSTNGSQEGRKQAILALLKTSNNLTIKDFSLVIRDCSEKTIQRELLKLVHEGVLRKEGERRWSRYSLSI